MNSTKETARVAGLLYLLLGITGAFSILYIPSAFIVPGDATATANKIVASELLYRIGIVSDLLSQIIFILLVLTLYQLLQGVNKKHASLMVILVSVSVAIGVVNLLNLIAPLILLSGADFLSVFTKPQLDALALGFLSLRSNGILVVSAFWGLWLFPFGVLVIKSGFLPRILGVLLIIACFAYLTVSFTSLLLPPYRQIVSQFMMVLEAGELPIIFWLLIKGAKVQPLEDQASRSG
ncbi:DUF4386 domain-containing protein [Candidatus Acetothermia bacterium]|nr:DUF4386 domain-containing protein [Candidatus Acetothermia bacterium]